MTVTVDSRGRITLPVDMRRQLDLGPGTKLSVSITSANSLELIRPMESIESLKGMLKSRRSLNLDEMETAIAEGACANLRDEIGGR